MEWLDSIIDSRKNNILKKGQRCNQDGTPNEDGQYIFNGKYIFYRPTKEIVDGYIYCPCSN